MNKKTPDFEAPKISDVHATDDDYVLIVFWADGSKSRVDLTEPIFRLTYLRPLRDKERFKKASVSDWGWSIAWDEDLDFSGENLWTMAKEQADTVVTPSDFRKWLRAHELTHQSAAEFLGVSKRSIDYYTTGAQPITRTFWLAMKGAEREFERSHLEQTFEREKPHGAEEYVENVRRFWHEKLASHGEPNDASNAYSKLVANVLAREDETPYENVRRLLSDYLTKDDHPLPASRFAQAFYAGQSAASVELARHCVGNLMTNVVHLTELYEKGSVGAEGLNQVGVEMIKMGAFLYAEKPKKDQFQY